MDMAARERPDARKDAEKGGFAAAGRTGDENILAGVETKRHRLEQWLTIGQRDRDVVERDGSAKISLDLGALWSKSTFIDELVTELGETIHGGAPLREGPIVADEPGESVVDLPEGTGDPHQ